MPLRRFAGGRSTTTSSKLSCESTRSLYFDGVSKKPLVAVVMIAAWLGSEVEGTHPLLRLFEVGDVLPLEDDGVGER